MVALLLLVYPLAALAHARLVRSSPANEAQLAEPPPRIELWFSELLEAGFNSVDIVRFAELADKQRSNLTQGAAMLDRDDRTHLVAPLRHLGPGRYAVEWRVLSRDGHTATGRFTFWIHAAR